MTDTPTAAEPGKILYERFMRGEYHAAWENLPAGTRDRWKDAASAVLATATLTVRITADTEAVQELLQNAQNEIAERATREAVVND